MGSKRERGKRMDMHSACVKAMWDKMISHGHIRTTDSCDDCGWKMPHIVYPNYQTVIQDMVDYAEAQVNMDYTGEPY